MQYTTLRTSLHILDDSLLCPKHIGNIDESIEHGDSVYDFVNCIAYCMGVKLGL
jgi:hypothetical protein